MGELVDLKLACNGFMQKQCSLEEVSGALSWVAAPLDIMDLINKAERSLEKIRFQVSGKEQYEEASRIVEEILLEIDKMR